MAEKRFRIRKKPIKPTRRKDGYKEVNLYSSASLRGVLDLVPRSIDYEYVGIACRKWGDCYNDLLLSWRETESDDEYNARVEKYREELSKYNKWRKENKAQIEAELVRRAKKKVVDAKKSIERLEKKLAIAKSRLEAQ